MKLKRGFLDKSNLLKIPDCRSFSVLTKTLTGYRPYSHSVFKYLFNKGATFDPTLKLTFKTEECAKKDLNEIVRLRNRTRLLLSSFVSFQPRENFPHGSAVGWPQNAENCDNIVTISLAQFGK